VLAVAGTCSSGYTASSSLAHTHFAGVGAYTSARCSSTRACPLLVGIVAGAVLATGLGYVLGSLCLRIRAIYLRGRVAFRRVDPLTRHRRVPDHAPVTWV